MLHNDIKILLKYYPLCVSKRSCIKCSLYDKNLGCLYILIRKAAQHAKFNIPDDKIYINDEEYLEILEEFACKYAHAAIIQAGDNCFVIYLCDELKIKYSMKSFNDYLASQRETYLNQ